MTLLILMQKKLSTVPEKPGVYLFKDRDSKVLYVGKAKGLRNRLRSYFQKSSSLDERKSAMMRSVRDFEYTVTENELEALVLEANLIKQYKPRFNVLLRDDKSYPYIKLTVNEKWPRLEVVRRIKKDGARYFGPYVPSGAMWNILSFIRNNFHIPTCKYSLEKRMRPCIQHQIKKCIAPCTGLVDHDEYMNTINEIRLLLDGRNKKLLEALEKKMKRLSEEMNYEEAARVRDRIKSIQTISESQKAVAPGLGDVDAIGFFRKENMTVFKILFSRNGIMIGSRDFRLKDVSGEADGYLMKNFIEQFYIKEIIPPAEIICSFMPEDSIILSSWLSAKKGSQVKISVPKRGIKKGLVEMAEENAKVLCISEKVQDERSVIKELAATMNLHKIPENIGAFDISNISGKEAAGAFVFWENGAFRKENYRHIKMDSVKGPDDYSMMKEMLRRTLKKTGVRGQGSGVRDEDKNKEIIVIPDLIIIDGGREHLNAALQVMKELDIDIDVIGVAKDPDRAFLPDKEFPVSLEDGRPASVLLKRVRDEAHRFAITYHKKLRTKRVFESILEKIPGIGRKRRFELLRHFGSIEAIRQASAEEISVIKGFNKVIAEKVLESLKKD